MTDAPPPSSQPSVAGPSDATVVAQLLHDFNTEFGEPSPGPDVLAARLERLLAGGSTLALLSGRPAIGFALVTLRPNVWYDGPVGLLDELYVVPDRRSQGIGTQLLFAAMAEVKSAGGELFEINVDGEDHDTRRFYERHGFACQHGGQAEPELYYSREL